MKYIVILADGMADEPLAELGGKTPIEYARTPNMDRIAREGMMGMIRTIPEGYEAGSDIANLGYSVTIQSPAIPGEVPWKLRAWALTWPRMTLPTGVTL